MSEALLPEERADLEALRVLLVDDHDLFRTGLRNLLAEQGLTIVGEAGAGSEAIRLVQELAPDVVVMDLNMPGMSGVEATRQITGIAPLTRVLVLTISDQDGDVMDAILAGACGYLLKDASPSELLKALETARAGGPFHTSGRADALRVSAGELARGRAAPAAELTPREREVLRGVLEGETSRAIAERLGLSARTVESHRIRLRRKLGARSSAELARRALELGLAPRPGKGTDP